MSFASINSTNPRTNPWNFHEKILRIGGAGKWGFFEAAILNFLSRPFWFFFASYQWKTQPIYMMYHFFLHYGWFFQNFGKEGRRTFMHTTCFVIILTIYFIDWLSRHITCHSIIANEKVFIFTLNVDAFWKSQVWSEFFNPIHCIKTCPQPKVSADLVECWLFVF